MRIPGSQLRLVGIALSPGGGGASNLCPREHRAEEELRQWLEARLDALGIDPVAYSRFVLSLLRRPDSAPQSPQQDNYKAGGGARAHQRSRLQAQRDQRTTVVQCLTSAADQNCGVEALVDELCAKLRDLEGGGDGQDDQDSNEVECNNAERVVVAPESLTARDKALRYYKAFPALQPTTPKKLTSSSHHHHKSKQQTNINKQQQNNNNSNSNNNNNNNKSSSVNNNNNNNNKNNNNKNRNKKTKMSIQTIESHEVEDKDSFGFVKSMERERERERELELDRQRLEQLQAKFDESLEALWDTGGANGHDTSSIWAAPTLSIPSRPSWPSDSVDQQLNNNGSISNLTTTIGGVEVERAFNICMDGIVDDSMMIGSNWSNDLTIKSNDEKTDYKLTWSDSIVDGPWCWRGLSNDLAASLGNCASPSDNGSFYPFAVGVGGRVTPEAKQSSSTKPPPAASVEQTAAKANAVGQPQPSEVPNNNNDDEEEEDLLTSTRTHFRPIKDDGNWADGTTFPINNSIERVSYRRSESGNLLYLPGSESPYMEYRESDVELEPVDETLLTLKFRVKQCDKYVQTDPIRSPVKRRIVAETIMQDYTATTCYTQLVDDGLVVANDDDDDSDIGDHHDQYPTIAFEWPATDFSLHNDRKRRHSSSIKCQPLAALRPLTL